MGLIAYLLLATQIFLVIAIPIDEGADVGIIKVHNGKKIVLNPGQFPFIVHLSIKRYKIEKDPGRIYDVTNSCGGVLISNEIILTAAHCVSKKKKKPRITAWLGILDTDLDKGKGQEIKVRGYTVHEDYVQAKEGSQLQNVNDIALLWLEEPAKTDGKYVKIAKLPERDFDAVGKRGWIIGWGEGSYGRKTTMLQKAVVRGVSRDECQKYYKRTEIPPKTICIMSNDQKATSTRGDSGGPFIVLKTVVGITSFGAIDWSNSDEEKGIISADAKKPAVYTSVARYIDWIHKNMEEGPKNILIYSTLTTTTRPRSPKRPKSPPRPNGSKLVSKL